MKSEKSRKAMMRGNMRRWWRPADTFLRQPYRTDGIPKLIAAVVDHYFGPRDMRKARRAVRKAGGRVHFRRLDLAACRLAFAESTAREAAAA